jgi:tetratricopeptide (TPR) repeat protein
MGINDKRLTAPVNLPRLRSANLWLWDAGSSRPRDPILFVSVLGKSFWRLGEAAAANGDLDRAEHCFRRAAVLMPDLPKTATTLSELQSRRGARGEAMETLARYISRHPRSPTPHLRIAQLHDSAGDTAAALREYRAYLELGPDEENRREVERRIGQLSGGPP